MLQILSLNNDPVVQNLELSNNNTYNLLPVSNDTLKHTLVLDIDETLVHSTLFRTNYSDIMEMKINYRNKEYNIFVNKRPFVDSFLQNIKDNFEVIAFTASSVEYADPLIDALDPKKEIFKYRLYRNDCTLVNIGNRKAYVKDLSRLQRNLSKVIIIDNSPISYLKHPENAIPITSWCDDENDTCLKDLEPLLNQIVNEKCIYPLVKQYQSSISINQ